MPNTKISFYFLALALFLIPLTGSLHDPGCFQRLIVAGFCAGFMVFGSVFWPVGSWLELLRKPLLPPLVLLLISMVWSTLQTPFTFYPKNALVITSLYLLFYIVSSSTTTLNKLYFISLLRIIYLCAVIVSILAIVQVFDIVPADWGLVPWEKGLGKRAYSTLNNPNALSGYLLLLWPSLAASFVFLRKLRYLALLAVLYVAFMLTNSWGAYIGGFVAIFMLAGLMLRRSTRYLISWRAMIVVLVLFLVINGSYFLFKGAETMGELTGLYRRELIYKTSLQMLKDAPAMGFGPENYLVYFPLYVRHFSCQERFQPIWKQYPNLITSTLGDEHNIYLGYAIGAGPWALFAFLWFLAVVYKVGWQNIEDCEDEEGKFRCVAYIGFLAGITGFLVQGLFSSVLHRPTLGIYFFALCGLMEGWQLSKIPSPSGFLTKPQLQKSAAIIGGLCFLVVTFSYVQYFYHEYKAEQLAFTAMQQRTTGQHTEAAQTLTRAVSFHHVFEQMYTQIGEMYLSIDDLVRAEAAFKRGLQFEPFNEVNFWGLGVVFLRKGDLKTAEYYLAQGITIEPLYLQCYFTLGYVMELQQRHLEAMVMLSDATRCLPWRAELWWEVCYFATSVINPAMMQKSWQEAHRLLTDTSGIDYVKPLALKGSYPPTPTQLPFMRYRDWVALNGDLEQIRILMQQHKWWPVEANLKKILEIYPHYPPAVMMLAETYKQTERTEEADTLVGETLNYFPDSVELLAWLEESVKETKEVKKMRDE